MMKKAPLMSISLVIFSLACNTNSKKSMPETEEGFVIERGLNVSHWLSQTEIRGEETGSVHGCRRFCQDR